MCRCALSCTLCVMCCVDELSKMWLKLVSLAKVAGLKVHAVMSFHQCGGNVGDTCDIPLPAFVRAVGSANPDIYYRDREGNANNEYLSLGVDNLALFNGKTPLELYRDFMTSFRDNVLKNASDVVTNVKGCIAILLPLALFFSDT